MENNKNYNKSQRTKKNNNWKGSGNSISETLKEPIPCPENYRKKFLNIVKDIDEDVGKGEKYNEFLIYTGVKDGFDNEIVLRLELLNDGFVSIRSGEPFSIYLETKYNLKTASNMIFERVNRKNHKGIIGLDETDWSVYGYCKIEEYPYVKWTITEVIEDITWSCCE